MKKIADELWAAGGRVPPGKEKYWSGYTEHSVERPLRLIAYEFERAIENREIWNAAILYEILVKVNECALYIAKNLGKALSPVYDRPEYIELILKESSARVYKILFHTGYAYEFQPYPSTPTHEGEIPPPFPWIEKKEIAELKGQLWGLTRSRAFAKWGIRARDSPEMMEVVARLKFLVDETMRLAEEAEVAAKKKDFLTAAAAVSQAICLHEAYHIILPKVSAVIGKEWKEITTEFDNSFKGIVSNIKTG